MFEFTTQKNNTGILIFIGQFTGRPVAAFDSAYVPPAMNIDQKYLPKKATKLKIQWMATNKNGEKAKKKKTMKGKKKKTMKGKRKIGVQGVSPCVLQTQIFQKKE